MLISSIPHMSSAVPSASTITNSAPTLVVGTLERALSANHFVTTRKVLSSLVQQLEEKTLVVLPLKSSLQTDKEFLARVAVLHLLLLYKKAGGPACSIAIRRYKLHVAASMQYQEYVFLLLIFMLFVDDSMQYSSKQPGCHFERLEGSFEEGVGLYHGL